jgi:hypothetical protein
LDGATTAHEVHDTDPATSQGIQGVVGDIGSGQFLGAAREDASHVGGNVADADDHRALAIEVEFEVRKIRVAVVPGDEIRGGMAPVQILPRDSEPPIGLGSRAEHDLMVVALKLGKTELATELDVPEETKARIASQLLVNRGHRFDLGMVRSNSETHETKRCLQALEQIGPNLEVFLLKQMLDRVETGRARPDHRDA